MHDNFRTQLTAITTTYHGYEPSQDFFQRLNAQLSGHGPAGYARKTRLIDEVLDQSKTDEDALNKCIAFYLREIKAPSAKGSELMRCLRLALQTTLQISTTEIEKHSPFKIETTYLGACDGACTFEQPDTEQGFLNVLAARAMRCTSASNTTFRAVA